MYLPRSLGRRRLTPPLADSHLHSYVSFVKKSYSIAEARNALGAVVHQAAAHGAVELTRRGKPVAVLVSTRAYAALRGEHSSFWEELTDLREAGIPEPLQDEFAQVRDREVGRDVEL